MMHVHLVFVTKYRCARFSADQLGFLKDIFEGICKDFNAELVEMNGERDHVHLLVNYPPNVSVSKLVNSLKGVSSRMLRKQSQARFERCFGSCLWSPSYFAASCAMITNVLHLCANSKSERFERRKVTVRQVQTLAVLGVINAAEVLRCEHLIEHS